MDKRWPAFFIGHGNPMNALSDNAWTRAWRGIGQALGSPRAVLCISAHWYVDATKVTAMPTPRTIHDFGGFPKALFDFRYPAPGDEVVAGEIQEVLKPLAVSLDHAWGLDHGTWSILCHLFPDAKVPVVQLSIDATQSPQFHYDLGRRLTGLRDEGIVIVGSGNLIHNLRAYAWDGREVEPLDWAVRFEEQAKALIKEGIHPPLIDYPSLGADALLSAPTPDHYLPLLYVLGAARPGDDVSFPVEGFDGGSISMLAVRIG